LPTIYVNNAKRDSKNIDILISNSTYLTNVFKQSFWYDGTILETGTPRNDFSENTKNFINKFGIKENGTASKQIVEQILTIIDRNDYK